jgi:MFS family permease
MFSTALNLLSVNYSSNILTSIDSLPGGIMRSGMASHLASDASDRRARLYPWVVLALFWVCYFLNHADRQILFSVFPLVKQELGLSNTQLGLLGSSFQWIYAILVPFAGLLGDSISRKNIILSALLVWSATTVCSGLVSGFLLFLLLRALTGAGEAFYYPAATSIISDYHGASTRAFAMSIHQTSLYFGVVVSGTLAGYIGQHFGWRIAFLIFGGTGIAVAAVIRLLLREPVRGRQEEGSVAADAAIVKASVWARLSEAFRSRAALALMISFIGMNFAGVAVVTWSPTLLYREFHYSLAEAGFHATVYHQLGAFLGVLVGGRLADRWAVRDCRGRVWVQAAGLLGAAPFLYWLGRAGSPGEAFLALGAFGVFRGVYDSNLFASVFEVITPGARSTTVGLMLSAGFLFGGSSPVVVGWLSQYVGLGAAVGATSACFLAGGLLMVLNARLWFGSDARRMRERLHAAAAV